jgi:hypothetical protein
VSTTTQKTSSSHLRFGLARVDITPPVGIYHRMWGAARHDRATDIHRPLSAEVMVLRPLDENGPGMARVQIDLVGIDANRYRTLAQVTSEVTGVPVEHVVITFSHTHAAGLMTPDRVDLPGGELIPAYLDDMEERIRRAATEAAAAVQPAFISYAVGRCNLAANRDYWDDENQLYACGFNPDQPADDTLLVARVVDSAGITLAVLVNYACHPTSLAWDNTLISPDYVGAFREEVERQTGAPSVFFQGACGDLGPRQGFVGDTAVADGNGRQLAYVALAALASLGPAAADFHYQGTVVSGATIGTWAYLPFSAERTAETGAFTGGRFTVDLPLKPKPDVDALQADLARWEARYQEADVAGEPVAARDARARAERARRWLMRIRHLPEGESYPFSFSVYRLGDAIWITCGGEPYNLLQTELRRRFPEKMLLVSPLAGDMQVAYLLPQERYGKGLYQEEPSILAPGCLERLIEAVARQIRALV